MPQVAESLAAVQRRIAAACAAAGRDSADVRLLAVTKGVDVARIRAALVAGQRELGESYLKEALDKIPQFAGEPVTWHFIGPIQSNKTRPIAEHFQWVHGVDRLKIAQRLSEQRPPQLPPLAVCVQVNISREASKAGCAPGEALDLCRAVSVLPRLALRGLMAIPAPSRLAEPRRAYHELHELFEALDRALPGIDTLSAGMSDDLEAAIAEGATLVRVGTAIFGPRSYS